jgi:glycosyltransferase involved in cell wall biosynthesis
LKTDNQKQPLVSIIIDNYNYARFLRRAIDSALGQTYANIEVVVVDDGSTDNSQEIMVAYGNRIVPVLKGNGGQASSLNEGFKASHGDIICFLDSDDYFLADKVMRIVELFESHPSIGWIFHRLEYGDKCGDPLSLAQRSDFIEITLIDLRGALTTGEEMPLFPTATSALCFRRPILKQMLPMPEALTLTADNYLKIALPMLSIGLYCPEKLAFLCIHGSNAYSLRKDINPLREEISIKTAFYLRERFYDIHRYTDKMFVWSLALLIADVGLKKALEIRECRQYVKHYFSTIKWFIFGPRLFYICLKLRWAGTDPSRS